MKKILFLAAIVFSLASVQTTHAQTALNGVRNVVTSIPQGVTYTILQHDNIVNIDTLAGWSAKLDTIYLPTTPQGASTKYPSQGGGSWFGLGTTYTVIYSVPDSTHDVKIFANPATSDDIDNGTSPVTLTYKSATKKTYVRFVYLGGIEGWKTLFTGSN